MRTAHCALTTLTLTTLLTAACVGEVGGGSATRGRGRGESAQQDTHAEHGDCTTAEPQRVEGGITIRSVADFDKLPKGCWDLYGKLRLEGPAITSLDKLGELIAVDALELVDTNIMSTVDTKKQIEVYGSLLVTGNNRLKDLDHVVAEEWPTVTAASVTIRNNAELASIGAVRYLKKVAGPVVIADNPKLAQVAFDELGSVQSLQVTNNGTLTRFDVSALTTVGKVEVTGNTLLTALDVSAAAEVGDLVIRNNPALTTLGSWSSLANVKGALTIDGNAKVTNFGALSGLRFVTGAVSIANNTQLTAIAPLGRLQGIGSTVSITGNTALSSCSAWEIDICVQSGAVSFSNNLPNTGNLNNCPLFWCEQQQ